ncbi:hypothetical protein F5X99DRAFT_407960 [Biscogniauxia marginata]|nr:hypothetical protein F5X99DRAFT_407960 [Biscogniauxia marginata]
MDNDQKNQTHRANTAITRAMARFFGPSESNASNMAAGLANGGRTGPRSRAEWFRLALEAIKIRDPDQFMAEYLSNLDLKPDEELPEEDHPEEKQLDGPINASVVIENAGYAANGATHETSFADEADEADEAPTMTSSLTSTTAVYWFSGAEEKGDDKADYVVVEEAISTQNPGHPDGEEEEDNDFVIV